MLQADIEDNDNLGQYPETKERKAKAATVVADRLRSLVERIERLDEEKKVLTSDIKDLFIEGKSAGYNVKALRRLIRERKQDAADVEEEETQLDLYRHALGMAR
jgi:uncharacterized protein (UPF0335 family)